MNNNLDEMLKEAPSLTLEPFAPADTAGGNANAQTTDNLMKREAIEALVALGYSASDATAAVKKVEMKEDTTVETILKQALKHMF